MPSVTSVSSTFTRLEGRSLPQWATEFGASTWAQFWLALGPLPNENDRKRMRVFITTV